MIEVALARNARRTSLYVALLGIAVLGFGFAGSAFDEDFEVDLTVSQMTRVGPYEVVFDRYTDGGNPRYDWMSAVLELRREGRPVGFFAPEQRIDRESGEMTSEARRYATLREDLYFAFAGITASGAARIQILRKPLVRLVWIGGAILFVGATSAMIVSLGVTRERRKPTSPDELAAPEVDVTGTADDAPRCSSCRTVLPDGSRFCYRCGLAVSE